MVDPSRALPKGTVLGRRYRVERLLGAGGMGAVYEATQLDLGRLVALKTLHGQPDRERLARFHREAIAAATLGHPNIVSVTDFQANPGEPPFLVMEHLRGATLGALAEAGRLTLDALVVLATQLLTALGVAHRAGIVHRDVKPDNVFVVEVTGVHGVVKVLDFGIAKLVDPMRALQTSGGVVMGSSGFMAPEQARGHEVDLRADLYSVGATMYYALARRVPGAPSQTGGTLDAPVSIGVVTPLSVVRPDLPPALVAVVERAMQANPAHRFASAEEMIAALRGAAHVASLAPPAAATPPTASPMHYAAPPPTTMTHVAPPAPTPKRRSATPLIALLGVLGLLFVVSAASAVAYMGGAFAPEEPVAVTPTASASNPLPPAPLTPSVPDEPPPTPTVLTARKKKPAPEPDPSPKPSPAPSPSPSPSPAPTPSVDPTPIATSVRLLGETTQSYEYFNQLARPIGARQGAVTACYVKHGAPPGVGTERGAREPFFVEVDPNGRILGLKPNQHGARSAARDACVAAALRGVELGPPRKKGPPVVVLLYEIK